MEKETRETIIDRDIAFYKGDAEYWRDQIGWCLPSEEEGYTRKWQAATEAASALFEYRKLLALEQRHEWADKYDIRKLADDCYPRVTPSVEMTHAQITTLFNRWKRSDNGMTWGDFLKSAIAGDFGSVVVQWCGMFLCVEQDGYGHT